MKLYVLICLFLTTATSIACERQSVITFSGEEGGMTRVFSIAEDKVATLPVWKPGKGKPPIGIEEAFIKANNSLNEKNYEFSNILVGQSKISFELPVWFYMLYFKDIKFTPVAVPGKPHHFKQKNNLEIVVLMDGTVLKGKILSEKEFHKFLRSGGC